MILLTKKEDDDQMIYAFRAWFPRMVSNEKKASKVDFSLMCLISMVLTKVIW